MSDKVQREKEEQYFQKKESDLRDKLRRRMQEAAEIARLKGEFGESDERVLKAFEEAGFSRETVVLLHLVPLVEVAWADGSVSAAERADILEVAKIRNIVPGSPAYDMLERGLRERPKPEMFDAVRRAIRIIFESLPKEKQDEIEKTVTSACMHVALASGGFLGMGEKVSDAERTALQRVARTFEEAHAAGARKVQGTL